MSLFHYTCDHAVASILDQGVEQLTRYEAYPQEKPSLISHPHNTKEH